MLVQVERMEGRAKVTVSYIIHASVGMLRKVASLSGVREVHIPREGGMGSNQDAGGGLLERPRSFFLACL